MIKISYISPIPKLINPNHPEYRTVFLSNFRKYRSATLTSNDAIEFDFSGYENGTNKDKIRGITKGNCSYCGIRTTDVTQLEVEHYRPKKRLDIRKHEFVLHNKTNHQLVNNTIATVRHGYFMHGNDYKNLTPSCPICNKGIKKKQSVLVVGKELVYGVSFGKRNYFPVLHTRFRGKKVDLRIGESAVLRITNEIPLLYNPYIDDPNSLFRYKSFINIDGAFYLKVAAQRSIDKVDRLKATISINLLGLNRKGLCEKRYKILLSLSHLAKSMKKDKEISNVDLNVWASYASNVASFFVPDDAELINFARQKGEKLPIELHRYLKRMFPTEATGILTSTTEVEQIVAQLKLFGGVHYDSEQHYEEADADIDSFTL